MNHKPASDWLFEEPDELTQLQSQTLQEHLAGCDSCQALADSYRQVAQVLRRSGQVEPEVGFSARWQVRLQSRRRQAHRRQIIAALAFEFGGMLALIGLLVWIAWPWLRSPSLLVWTWIYQWITLITYANSVREMISPAVREIATLTPWFAWVIGLGVFSEMAVLWVVSYKALTSPRRVTK